jgi:hypothetical protein
MHAGWLDSDCIQTPSLNLCSQKNHIHDLMAKSIFLAKSDIPKCLLSLAK